MTIPGPILITGAAGFVGANLCRYFLEKGNSVIAIESQSGNNWRLPASPQLQRISVDLTQESQVHDLVNKLKPSVILNLSAYGAYSHQTDANKIYPVNMDSVRFLLDSVRDQPYFRAFIQAGSSSEYGSNCTAPAETSPTFPDSHYAVSKLGATSLVQLYAHKYNIPAWSLRLYSVYGPFEDISRMIMKLLLSAREGKLPPLVDPRISRDFIFISDVCSAFESILLQSKDLKKGEIFNIGTGRKTSLEELVGLSRSLFKITEKPNWGSMKNRHWDHPDWYSNPSKAQNQIGWKAGVSLQVGLVQTMKWIEENLDLIQIAQAHSVIHRR